MLRQQEKLFGFGHRVYKNFDPRATQIRKLADDVFAIAGRDPLIDVAVELERIALSDPYFVDRKLYPNVDFYSGLVYRAMGFPPAFFTCLFAIPRIAGYLSHWRESLDDPDTKILRPHQDYRVRTPPLSPLSPTPSWTFRCCPVDHLEKGEGSREQARPGCGSQTLEGKAKEGGGGRGLEEQPGVAEAVPSEAETFSRGRTGCCASQSPNQLLRGQRGSRTAAPGLIRGSIRLLCSACCCALQQQAEQRSLV